MRHISPKTTSSFLVATSTRCDHADKASASERDCEKGQPAEVKSCVGKLSLNANIRFHFFLARSSCKRIEVSGCHSVTEGAETVRDLESHSIAFIRFTYGRGVRINWSQRRCCWPRGRGCRWRRAGTRLDRRFSRRRSRSARLSWRRRWRWFRWCLARRRCRCWCSRV